MKKIFTHWTIGLLTLAILTFIGLNDPYLKQILRLKSFDYLHQYETKEISPDIGVVSRIIPGEHKVILEKLHPLFVNGAEVRLNS